MWGCRKETTSHRKPRCEVNKLEMYQMQQSEGTKSGKGVQEKGYSDDLNNDFIY